MLFLSIFIFWIFLFLYVHNNMSKFYSEEQDRNTEEMVAKIDLKYLCKTEQISNFTYKIYARII